LGQGRAWDGNVGSLEKFLQVPRTQAMVKLQEVTGLDPVAATRMLWETYHPHLHVWVPFALIGVVAAIALWLFGRQARRWSDMNA
jgi:sensor c-di-GMP phosphodiesterase-like protein